MKKKSFCGVGKRKRSVARVYLVPAQPHAGASITVNGIESNDYFKRPTLRMMIRQPLELTKNNDAFHIKVNVMGGGLSGQAGAVRHGITRALLEMDPDLRAVLKEAGFVTRDSRMKERKMYGLKAARARYQYSKR